MAPFTVPVGNKPPPGYITLNQIQNVADQSSMDIFGIVVSARPPTATRYEHKMTLTITAPEIQHGYEDIAFFDKQSSNLPTFVAVGDVVMIKRARRINGVYNTVKSQFMSVTTVFSNATIPDEAFMDSVLARNSSIPCRVHPESKRMVPPPTPEEQYYAMQLKSWAQKNKLVEVHASTHASTVSNGSTFKMGLKPLSSLRTNNFYDVVVEVVKIWTELATVTLYVTDYTENPHFYDTRADKHARAEWLSTTSTVEGKILLQVTLFSPNAEWASDYQQDLKGRLVYIRNLNIQAGRHAAGGIIEGKLHGDRQRPNQIDIHMVEDEDARAKDLIARRKAYFGDTREKHLKPDQGVKLSKNQKKKQRQRERDRNAVQQKETARNMSKNQPTRPDIFEASKGVNPNVVTMHDAKPCQSLHSIRHSPLLHGKTESGGHITYPFMNVAFRARVKVVDFKPDRLADFAQSLEDATYNDDFEQVGGDESPISATPVPGWEWAFSLLLQCDMDSSKPEYIVAVVQGHDAAFLLNLDACDLRREPNVLAQLKSRLFFLWGELEEVKARSNESVWPLQVKNRAFECCLHEYGVLDDEGEWIRMHRMTGTKIRED